MCTYLAGGGDWEGEGGGGEEEGGGGEGEGLGGGGGGLMVLCVKLPDVLQGQHYQPVWSAAYNLTPHAIGHHRCCGMAWEWLCVWFMTF